MYTQAGMDRAGIAERLRGLLLGRDADLEETAARLGVDEAPLRRSMDVDSPHPEVEVLAAVIRVYGIDPSWLLAGVYDAATHRAVMEGDVDAATSVGRFVDRRPPRISTPTSAGFHFDDQI